MSESAPIFPSRFVVLRQGMQMKVYLRRLLMQVDAARICCRVIKFFPRLPVAFACVPRHSLHISCVIAALFKAKEINFINVKVFRDSSRCMQFNYQLKLFQSACFFMLLHFHENSWFLSHTGAADKACELNRLEIFIHSSTAA
jgi:hypothetical protein